MLLLQANHIQKSYGTKTVLDFKHFAVYEGEKIGIVGENGAGKSTLLQILSRELEPDTGTVSGSWKVSYIRQFDRGDATRSGGENRKSHIQRHTLEAGSILFADEPTANLDEDGQKWVRSKLREASTVLLVSHDRGLLDEICTKIVELKDGKLTEYTGNFSAYETAVAVEAQRQQASYQEYRRKKAQLEAAIQAKERKVSAMNASKKRQYATTPSEARLYIGKRAEKMKKVQQGGAALKNRLERLEAVEQAKEPPALRIDFSLTRPPGNKYVITCRDLHFSYGGNKVFDGATFSIPNRAKVAVTGRNGAGKTTLLNLVAGGHEAVTTAPKLRPGFLYQNFENLDLERTVLDNVLLTCIQDYATVRSVLAGLLFFGDQVFKKAAVLSGGEKMRLSIAKLLTCEANALLLDEPTNYLDLRAVEAVQRMVSQYPGTVLLVSHDERFVREVAKDRLHIENGKAVYRRIADEAAPPPSNANKTLLELRLTRLVADISSSPPEKKTLLEAEYQETLRQLRALG